MKKFIKRFLVSLGIVILMLIAAGIILPLIYKGRIVSFAKEQANKSLNAKLDFDNNISLSLFKHFPDFSLGIDNIRIINNAPFEGDTLVDIGSLQTTLDIMSVIKGGKIEIKSIIMDKPYINLHVLEDGRSNWDIALKNKDTLKKEGKDTTSNFKLRLQKYQINQGKIIYDDKSLGFYMKLDSFNHSGQGDFTSDVFDLKTQSSAKEMTVGYGGINYLYKIRTKIDALLNINMKESKYTLKNNDITLNDLNILLDGFIAMPADDIDMDLKFRSKQTDFKNILSLVPGIYQHNFRDLKSSGKMAFGGDVKGIYNAKHYPSFHVNLDINDGMFQYPGLPGSVNHVNVATVIQNPGGILDNTIINIKTAHIEMGGETADAHLLLKTPMSDPDLDAGLIAKITLDKIKNFISLGSNTSLSGIIDANLNVRGRINAIQKKDFDHFTASGYVNGQNIGYASPSLAQALKISSIRLDFNPQDVKLSNMALTYGNSDLRAEGNLNNLPGYVLKNQVLTGNLTMTSNNLDINQMMPKSDKTDDKPVNSSSSKMSAPELPSNIDFTFKATVAKMKYDNYDISNFNGIILFKDKRITLQNISLNMMNASFSLKGFYDSKNPKKPLSEINFDVKQLSIPEAFRQFTSVQKFAPITQYINGIMNGNVNLTTTLGQDMMPDWSTFLSQGVLDIPKATVSGFAPLNELAEKLKMSNLKTLVLTGIHPSYYITNGRIYLKNPVQFKVDQATFNLIGSSGIDKTLDYIMQVDMPAKQLQNQANSIIDQALKQKNMNVLADQNVKATVLITGTIDKPVFKISMKDLMTGTANALKDKAKEELEKQKQELEKKGQQELDKQKEKIKQEAQKQQEELNKKIEAEKKKQQDQVNKQVEQQKKNLEEQGKNKLKDLFKK